IDSLIYTYPTNSNRLLGVRDIDSSITKSAQLGDFIDGNTGVKDYSYDVNGNMIVDLNKGISSIVYNHLNIPSVITFSGK
ncbi:RHS repeat-associated core domain-containing protein, partial [Acinetobacter baumannii]